MRFRFRRGGRGVRPLFTYRVNYDDVAPTYNGRYARKGLEGISSALQALARNVRPERIFEVGCGTGHWLEELSPLAHHVPTPTLSVARCATNRSSNSFPRPYTALFTARNATAERILTR